MTFRTDLTHNNINYQTSSKRNNQKRIFLINKNTRVEKNIPKEQLKKVLDKYNEEDFFTIRSIWIKVLDKSKS